MDKRELGCAGELTPDTNTNTLEGELVDPASRRVKYLGHMRVIARFPFPQTPSRSTLI